MDKYNYVFGISTPVGWVYRLQGDNLSSLTKKDCEHRIRMLFNSGVITRGHRDYLLVALRGLKRGT